MSVMATKGVPHTAMLELNVPYTIVEAYEFTREQNELVCQAFESSNPVHLKRGVVPGNLVTGWITERLRDWALTYPQFSGKTQVVLNQMSSITFLEPVWVGRPVRLVVAVISMSPEHLEFCVELGRVGANRVALTGIFGGGIVRSAQ